MIQHDINAAILSVNISASGELACIDWLFKLSHRHKSQWFNVEVATFFENIAYKVFNTLSCPVSTLTTAHNAVPTIKSSVTLLRPLALLLILRFAETLSILYPRHAL